MKTNIVLVSTLIMFLVSCNNSKKVEKLENDDQKAAYGIGTTFATEIDRFEQTLPLEEKADVEEVIKGMNSIFNSSEKVSDSYFQGMQMAIQLNSFLRANKITDKISKDIIYQGVRDKIAKGELLMQEDSIQTFLQTYFQPISQKAQDEQRKNSEARLEKKKKDNLDASEKFLATNKSKAGVKTTASGLQYQIMTAGTGESPTLNDKVSVIYKGTTIDGKTFDDSKGAPVEFNLSEVVPGWTEGIQLLKKGGKAKLFIPSSLGYGEQGSQAIEPNQALIFEVELVDFKPIPAEELKQMEDRKKQQEEFMRQQQAQQAAQALQQGGN